MAIELELREDNKATPNTIWVYGGIVRGKEYVSVERENFLPENVAGVPTVADEKGNPIEEGAVIRLNGYTSIEARQAAKANGYAPDKEHFIFVTDYKFVTYDTRPATLEEKKERLSPEFLEGRSDEELEALDYDIILSITENTETFYKTFLEQKAISTDAEKVYAYHVIKTHPHVMGIFTNGVQI